jgi:ribosome-associated heat shock protein Hsp15
MDAPVRVDKWLWAARLVKTRAVAVEAIKGGRVHVNGRAVKPSKDLVPGDELELTTGPVRLTVVVRGTRERRVSASEAALLYDETPESRETRERQAAERRLAAPLPGAARAGRPTKRDRRRFEKETGSRGRRT